MAVKIYVKGNFFFYEDSSNQVWVDNRENALVYKNTNASTDYNILLKSTNTRFIGVAFSNINDESGTPYASQSVFETYIYENTGMIVSVGSGTTNLSYTASPINGIIESDTGTNATIPLADGVNAGLITPAEKNILSNTSGTNTGDQTSIVGITGTKAEFDTACTDENFAYQSDIEGFSSAGSILAITEISNSTMVYHTVPTGSNFTAINLNSDATNRYAKITFTAPSSGKVLLSMLFDMIIVNTASVQMIGIHSSSTSTTTPDGGWYRVNADNDATSGQFYAEFVLTGLTPSSSYTYYFMGVCNYSSNKIRASQQQTGAYSSGSDLPAPLRITATDLGSVSITSNPSS